MGDHAAGWNLTIVPDAAAMSLRAADIVAETLEREPDAALAVPTGSTPVGMFNGLIARARRGDLSFGQAHLFCLDEYVGLGPDDPNSLTGWLSRSFLAPIGLRAEQIHTLSTTEVELAAAATRYEEELAVHGGLTLAVLGLGANGHIAYNEPGSEASSRTRVIDLSRESIAQAGAAWNNMAPIPRQAMTVGVGTLLESKRIILIVSGAAKTEVLRRALRDPMSAEVPASWLRLAGARLEIIADEAAAGLL